MNHLPHIESHQFERRRLKFSIKLKSVLCSAVLLISAALPPTTAEAAETDNKDYCVYAKPGIMFAMEAHWFDKDGTEVRDDTLPVGQWSCAPNGAKAVSLNVWNGEIGTKTIQAALLGATGVTAAVACIGSVGAGCPAAAAIAGTAAAAIIEAIPSPEGTFTKAYFSEPEYIEVTGTMWKPKVSFAGERCSGC